MEKSIQEYADALYIKALHDAREKHKEETTEAAKQMAQRGLSQSFSGLPSERQLRLTPRWSAVR